MFSKILQKIKDRQSLSVSEMEQAVSAIVDSSVSEDEIVQFLEGLRDKGETEDELLGLVRAMRGRMQAVDLGTRDFIDTCGTGGSGKTRFNISSAASLIAVAAGAKIAKHGNRAASSQSGSADFLQALGYPLDLQTEQLKTRFAQTGFCFFFAPHFHPAMAKVAAARKRIGTKTIFNCLGPLLNPAGAKRQIIGVYSLDRMRLMAGVIARDRGADVLFVHGDDGMDEVTLSGSTTLLSVQDGKMTESRLDPQALGLSYCRPEDLQGASAQENAERFLRLIEASHATPLGDCLVLNAALIYAFYRGEAMAISHLHHIRRTLRDKRVNCLIQEFSLKGT